MNPNPRGSKYITSMGRLIASFIEGYRREINMYTTSDNMPTFYAFYGGGNELLENYIYI